MLSAARPFAAALLFAAAVLVPQARGGGLVWSLPEPGTEVRHEGTLTQTVTSADNQVSTIQRRRHITLRALEAETATVDGQQVPARWLEIVSETGTRGEAGLDTGPAGRVLYKILVPESAVTGRVQNENGIPEAFLPVIRGWKQVGAQPATEFGPVLRAYPTLTLLTEYEPAELTEEGPDAVDTPAGRFEGTRYRGKAVEESQQNRVTNEGTFVVSPNVPFGPASWDVTLTREEKDISEARDAFRETSKIVVQMSVHEVSANARGELALP